MGIIRKQSLQSSIFIYIGFTIGALNILVLFPNEKYFTLDQFGLTKILVDVALLIAMLCTVGTCPATVKFYPFYQSYLPKKKNDLPFITLLGVITGCLLFIVLMPFLKDSILRKYGEKSPLFVEYFYLIYPLTISMAFLYLFEAYSWAVKKTVLPAIMRELLIRVLTTLLILLVMARILDFHQFINLYALVYVPPVLILAFSLFRSGDISLHFTISSVTKRLWKRILIFGFFIFSGQALNILARSLDSIIISSQSAGGLKDTGIFTIATYFIALMEVPVRGMTGIAFAVLAQAWKDNDRSKVFEVYQKTALNLLIAGLGIMGVLLLNMADVTAFLGSNYGAMTEVVWILGLSKLIDLGTGLNSHLLLSSKRWRLEFITNIFLVLMAGVFNYILVRKYGIVGSAWATLIAFALYNGIRFFLIWKLFKMQPFSMANLTAIFFAVGCFLVCRQIPQLKNIYADVLIRTILFSGGYVALVLRFRLSPDVNDIVQAFLKRLRVK